MEIVLTPGGESHRCPHCMGYLLQNADCVEGTVVTCGLCKRRFPYRYLLPSIGKEKVRAIEKKTETSPVAAAWALCLGGLVLSYFLTQSFRGVAFLFYYFFLWLLLALLGVTVLKKQTIPLVLLFLGVAFERYVYGTQHGMQKWGMLGQMCLYGGVLLVIVVARGELGRWGDGSCSSSGCGSSCGGGCGGGCGGCGS